MKFLFIFSVSRSIKLIQFFAREPTRFQLNPAIKADQISGKNRSIAGRTAVHPALVGCFRR
jgi:hypothetical protein